MPIHDWTRVDAGLFHDFHQSWIVALCNALNAGGLPPDYFALAEQSIHGPIPDVLALHLAAEEEQPAGAASPGLAVATVPPRAHLIRSIDERFYARKADRVTVRHRLGAIVAVIEVVSPGNKASKHALRSFVETSTALIEQGVHVLVIDLFPPSRRDPQGIHKAIWDEFTDEEYSPPPGKPLTVAAYDAGPPVVAYVDVFAVGDALPDMPLFLKPEFYVPTPLESTYEESWNVIPAPVKRLLFAAGLRGAAVPARISGVSQRTPSAGRTPRDQAMCARPLFFIGRSQQGRPGYQGVRGSGHETGQDDDSAVDDCGCGHSPSHRG